MQKKRMLFLLNVNMVANIRSHINLYILKVLHTNVIFCRSIGRFKKGKISVRREVRLLEKHIWSINYMPSDKKG